MKALTLRWLDAVGRGSQFAFRAFWSMFLPPVQIQETLRQLFEFGCGRCR